MTSTLWQRQRLGGLVRLTSGQSPSGFTFGSGGVPYFKVEQLGRSTKYLDRTTTPYQAHHLPTVPAGSVLIAKRGAAIALNRVRLLAEPGFMDTNVMALSPSEELESEYLYYWLSHRGLWDIADVTSVPQINNKHIKPLEIDLPDVDEQRVISAALRDVDALVLAIGQQIAKKRAIKQGMMQELLTGRTRLPGFPDAWSRVRLSEVASVDPESLSPATTSPSEQIDYISLEDVSRGSILGSTAYRFVDAPSRARRRIRAGDVLFGTVRPNLQSHAQFTGGLRHPVASTGFAVIRSRPGTTDPSFLAQWVLSSGVLVQIDRIIAGSNYPAVSSGDVRNLELSLPSVEEQEAIGDVLRDANSEIVALERRLEATRAIKQGMMQELLTGRTRLVPTEASA